MNTRRPAVFLDRDGTLIEDRGFLSDPAQVEFFPETADALRGLSRTFELFIVTNQRGIAEGTTRLEDVQRVNDHVVRVLSATGIVIRAVYCCPHRREDGCECIKPKPYFVRLTAREYGLDLARSFVVGDHPHDAELAANAADRAACDAASLYDKLENVILPLFYQHPGRFIDVMRHAIALNGSFFNTQRMILQYVLNAYFR